MDIGRRFGVNLVRARRASGLSQERLATRAGLHRTEIGLLEHGRRVPRIDTVARLAGALGIGPGELLIGISSSQSQKGHISQEQDLNRRNQNRRQERPRQTE